MQTPRPNPWNSGIAESILYRFTVGTSGGQLSDQMDQIVTASVKQNSGSISVIQLGNSICDDGRIGIIKHITKDLLLKEGSVFRCNGAVIFSGVKPFFHFLNMGILFPEILIFHLLI